MNSIRCIGLLVLLGVPSMCADEAASAARLQSIVYEPSHGEPGKPTLDFGTVILSFDRTPLRPSETIAQEDQGKVMRHAFIFSNVHADQALCKRKQVIEAGGARTDRMEVQCAPEHGTIQVIFRYSDNRMKIFCNIGKEGRVEMRVHDQEKLSILGASRMLNIAQVAVREAHFIVS